MPFRPDPSRLRERCFYCAHDATGSCRHCGRTLCEAHTLRSTFFVPVAECAQAVVGKCERPRGALRRRAHRARALANRLFAPLDALRRSPDG